MFDISSTERTRVLSEISRVRTEIHQEVLDIFRGFVLVAYDSVLDKTPQWTGHAAAQWNIGVHSLDVSKSNVFLAENIAVSEAIRSKSRLDKLAPAKQKGDVAAINEAKGRQTGDVERMQLKDMIYISNSVEAALRGSYASKLEENPNNYLRDVNLPGQMIMRTLHWFNSRLAVIDETAQLHLKMVKLSDSGVMEII